MNHEELANLGVLEILYYNDFIYPYKNVDKNIEYLCLYPNGRIKFAMNFSVEEYLQKNACIKSSTLPKVFSQPIGLREAHYSPQVRRAVEEELISHLGENDFKYIARDNEGFLYAVEPEDFRLNSGTVPSVVEGKMLHLPNFLFPEISIASTVPIYEFWENLFWLNYKLY